MAFTFKIAPHSVRPGEQMVEVWSGDYFVGGLYPGDTPDALRFVSKYLQGATLDQREPPTVEIILLRSAVDCS